MGARSSQGAKDSEGTRRQMAIIIDGDVIICGEKGTFDLGKWLRTNSEEQFQIAAITVAELWHGIERATGPHKHTRASYLQAVVERLPILPLTRSKPRIITLRSGPV
jgi:predicted nucleic acid-binding protein